MRSHRISLASSIISTHALESWWRLMGKQKPEIYSLTDCRIIKHQHYGLVVRTMPGDDPGYVDESAIADQPSLPCDEWPSVGTVLMCVVLGHAREGRLRLSARPRDIRFASAVEDVEQALLMWHHIRDDATSDKVRILDFLETPEAVPILRWALCRPRESTDYSRASEIVREAPEGLARRLG